MILCIAFTAVAYIIATNYIGFKWSLIPAAIVFVLMYIGVYHGVSELFIGVLIATFVALLITVIKNHFEK